MFRKAPAPLSGRTGWTFSGLTVGWWTQLSDRFLLSTWFCESDSLDGPSDPLLGDEFTAQVVPMDEFTVQIVSIGELTVQVVPIDDSTVHVGPVDEFTAVIHLVSIS
jgi:hypothetical protein